MSGALRVVHSTGFEFDEVVRGGCVLDTRLEPRAHRFHQLVVRPHSEQQRERDEYGNATSRIRIAADFRRLEVTAISTVEPDAKKQPSAALLEQGWRPLCEREGSAHASYCAPTPRVPLDQRDYAERHMGAQTSVVAAVEALIAAIRSDFSYDTRATGVDTPLSTFVSRRRGVCQDFTHFALACVRSLGLRARYVSGYLADPNGREQTQSHAWLALWLGADDWLEVDPTLGRLGPQGHITLAVGRDYDDVAPLRGTLDHHGPCRMTTRVNVAPDLG